MWSEIHSWYENNTRLQKSEVGKSSGIFQSCGLLVKKKKKTLSVVLSVFHGSVSKHSLLKHREGILYCIDCNFAQLQALYINCGWTLGYIFCTARELCHCLGEEALCGQYEQGELYEQPLGSIVSCSLSFFAHFLSTRYRWFTNNSIKSPKMN